MFASLLSLCDGLGAVESAGSCERQPAAISGDAEGAGPGAGQRTRSRRCTRPATAGRTGPGCGARSAGLAWPPRTRRDRQLPGQAGGDVADLSKGHVLSSPRSTPQPGRRPGAQTPDRRLHGVPGTQADLSQPIRGTPAGVALARPLTSNQAVLTNTERVLSPRHPLTVLVRQNLIRARKVAGKARR